MKALVALLIAALAGINLYQYVQYRDLQIEADLLKTETDGKLENAKVPLIAENAKLANRTQSLEAKIDELENELSTILAKASPNKNDTTPLGTEPEEGGDMAPMANLAEMLKNPQMKEMMAAQQKATLDMMYKGLYEKFGLEGEDLEHFKKLLTDGQMAVMESGMSLMDPDLTEEQRKDIYDKIAKGQEDLKANVKEFLNDEEDYKQYEFYSSTLGERMTVSGVQAQLQAKDIGMEPAQEESLIQLMHDEREKVPFDNTYYDQNSYDPTTLTNESIDTYMNQYADYENNVNNRVGDILSPEQAEIFKQQQEQSRNMQKMGLKMAAGMFGGGK